MKFKKISIILSLLSYKAFSVPFTPDITKVRNKSKYIRDNIDNLENEIYDTLPDNIDDIIQVTDAINEDETDIHSDDECTTKECIEISKRILSSLDTSVNPCDDFYEFSCGGWIAMNNKKKVGYSHFNEISERISNDLREIFESSYQVNEKLSKEEREHDEMIFNKTKSFYTSCINTYNNRNEELINFINKFNITESLSNRDSLTTLFAELHNYNIVSFFDVNSQESSGLPYRNIPRIEIIVGDREYINFTSAILNIELSKDGLSIEGGFSNEEEYNKYLQDNYKIIENYKEYMRKVLKTIYDPVEDSNKIDTMIESIIEVTKNISMAYLKVMNFDPKPIYSTETKDNENNIENEHTDYENNKEIEISDYENNIEIEISDYENDIEIESSDYEYSIEIKPTDYEYSIEIEPTDYYYDDNEEMNQDDNVISIKSFNEKYPLINWKLYFEKRFEFYGSKIPVSEELKIYGEKSFEFIYKSFEKINNKDMSNYLEWKIIESVIGYSDLFENIISEELYQIYKEFKQSLKNETDDIIMDDDESDGYMNPFRGDDANSKCLNILHNMLPLSLSKYYIERKFPENIKSVTMDIVENIRNSMINRLKELEWLDESTREYAIEKVLKIKYALGYPDYIMNIENIYNDYKPLENIKDDFLSLFMGSNNADKKYIFDKLYTNEKTSIFDILLRIVVPSYMVNAFYSPDDNSMNFPAAILQTPFFDINQPNYINYGLIGYVMGHELTHAFDNSGKDYDAEGNLNNWWTDNDTEEFNEYSQCFIDQYSSFSSVIEGKEYHVDGENTLGENLADNGGLDRSYEAWKLSIINNPDKSKELNMRLPGLSEYSLDQLFYISFGQSFCSVGMEAEDFENEHSPDRFRINGVVNNSKRFAKIFNCQPKTPMNQENKCILW